MATVTNYDLLEDLFHFIKNPDVDISDVIDNGYNAEALLQR